MLGSVQKIGQVKVLDVVSCDDVRIRLSDEGCPFVQELRLLFTRDDMTANYLSAGAQGKHIADKWFSFSLSVK